MQNFLIYLILQGVVKSETRLNSWTCANFRKLLCQKNINESLFCHSSDTIPLALYNELCRIMNTDLMMIMYNSSKSVSRHRNQMGLQYMFAYLWSLKHEVRHYRKRPNKMRCKQFPRYLWNVETMPRNLRLTVGILSF